MSEPHLDSQAVLADLKDFQRRTALWTFERMFAERDPAVRFLVADEVGLGKTHVAKGVIALVIEHLRRIGDERHDIVYVCSNAAIARQNLRKLVPKGIEPLEDVDRLDRFLESPLSEEPTPAAELLSQIDDLGSPATMATAGGRYFGLAGARGHRSGGGGDRRGASRADAARRGRGRAASPRGCGGASGHQRIRQRRADEEAPPLP